MEVNGQPHAPAALPTEAVWNFREAKALLPLPGIELRIV